MADRTDVILGPSSSIRGQIVGSSDMDITAPENIIKNLVSARAVYWKYRVEHLKRIDLYSMIEGLIAGNPPYNPGELMKMGLTHIANFNTLDARALYKRSCLAYWNLVNEAETLIKFTINNPQPEAREFEDIMSKEWDYVVRQWPSFETQMGTLSSQLVKFGISPILWPDERDWRWRTIELSKFFIADQCQSDIDQMTCVCVESYYSAQYLFEVYEQFKDVPKDKSPWNCEELAFLLLQIANSFAKTNYDFSDFYDLQKRLQNGDLNYDTIFSDAIRLVSLLYKEYDGKVSHYMFHRTFDKGDFLYFADRQYNSFQEALVIYTFSPGDYTIHSNRGVGHEIFSISQLLLQLDCSIADGSRWAATPLIKGLSTGAKDIEQIRWYPGVPINIGMAEMQQNGLGANLQQLIGVSQYFTNKMMFNTANAGSDPSRPDADKGSLSDPQAALQSYKEFSVLKNNIAHFYKSFDTTLTQMVIKMLRSKKGYPGNDYVVEWKERCIEQGVPEEMFSMAKISPWGMPRQLSCKASRVAGDGSTAARIVGLRELQPISGDFGPKEAREYRRQWIMSTMGKEYVGAFMQNVEDTDAAQGGATVAALENAIMQDGKSPVFSLDNDHQAHFDTHLALGKQLIDQLQQQQMDHITADKVFTVMIPHMQEHFAAASKSMFSQGWIVQRKKYMDDIARFAILNRRNASKDMEAQIRQQQEAQAAQQQAMSDAERKDFVAKRDVQRADYKVQSQVERAKEANETRANVMREKVQKDADNKRLQVQLENEAKKEKVEIENPRAELTRMSGITPAPNDIESPVTTPFTNLVTNEKLNIPPV